jgi:hypothetical protein
MDIIAILEGIISSVPEAIELYHKIAPMINVRADIHPDQIAEVKHLATSVSSIVSTAHDAIATLIDTHSDKSGA